VVVDRPNASRQDDAKFATRIVKSVLTEVLPYLDIFMTEPLSDDERAELEAQEIAYRESLASAVSGNDIGEGAESETPAEGGEGSADPSAEEPADEPATEQSKPEITIDPESGLGVLPDGTKVDPVTGEPVESVELNLPDPIITESTEQEDGSPF